MNPQAIATQIFVASSNTPNDITCTECKVKLESNTVEAIYDHVLTKCPQIRIKCPICLLELPRCIKDIHEVLHTIETTARTIRNELGSGKDIIKDIAPAGDQQNLEALKSISVNLMKFAKNGPPKSKIDDNDDMSPGTAARFVLQASEAEKEAIQLRNERMKKRNQELLSINKNSNKTQNNAREKLEEDQKADMLRRNEKMNEWKTKKRARSPPPSTQFYGNDDEIIQMSQSQAL